MNRFKRAKIASVLGIIGNILLFVIKVIGAFFSRSEALLADAFNSGSDIFTSIITFIGNKISSKPIDDDHDLGHGKAEYIFSLLISTIMILFSFMVMKSSLLSIIKKESIVYSNYLIIICLVTIIVKLSLYIYTNKIAKLDNNILMNASAKDHRNDVLITSLNLISFLLYRFNLYFLDGSLGIIISIWIVISSIKLFKESFDVLMDKTISLDTKNEVLDIISNHKEIVKVNHFNATPIGYRYQISLSIFVDGNLSTFASHKIADDLEKEIISKIDKIYLVIIHVNPI